MNIDLIIEEFKNNIDFYLRNHIKISRKNYSETSEKHYELFKNNNKPEWLNSLIKEYDFNFFSGLNKENYLQNIYFLNVFNKYLSKNLKNNCSILDIGSKNWHYVRSEYIYFSRFCSDFYLDGIEIDPNRLCVNLYSRYEIAKYYTKNLKNTKYICGDFLETDKKYDYIIWVLPFITKYPHVKWGLPLKYFKPEEMLKKAYNILKDKGEILVINQGEEEYRIQQKMCKKLNITAEYYGEIGDYFNLFKNKRFCLKIIKN